MTALPQRVPRGNAMIKWLLVALVFGLALVLWRSVAFASSRMPKAGDDAPAFSLADQSGTLRNSGDFRGKWLALYFYPRDDTPGCTAQACAFRDDMRELEALGAQVVGVSVDNTASHAQFAQ